jgi:hypothetical protein
MIASARALVVLAVLTPPARAMTQQPRPQTVFSPAQNGTLSIRVAVVLPDYSVKPLPLIPVTARRNDRADSVAGRTDLDGRLTMTLPAGAYTIGAHTPLPVGGRSYMWAVPVAIRASMTEVIQLTNANAAVDSVAVAATRAEPVTSNRQAPAPESVPTSTPPAVPVAEAAPTTSSFSTLPLVESTRIRANTSRFFLGISLNGSAIRFDDDSDEIDSGGGISAQLGWGFTQNFALIFDLSAAAISTDGGDFGLGHAEIGGRWHFVSPTRALVPFLEVGYAGRAIVQEDMFYYDDFGNSYSGDFTLSGTGVAFGGGLQYHVTPAFALGGSMKWTVGKFTTVELDDVSVDGLDIKATTARLNLGFTWYPVTGAVR